MKKIICFSLLLNLLLSGKAQTAGSMESLKQQIATVLGNQKGIFAVAFKNLQNGNELLINEHEIFHAASTMKTPVMMEVFKQAAEGRFSLSDSLYIRNEFKSIVDSSLYTLDFASDSDNEIYSHVGEKRTVRQLVYDMIIRSSNLSTNLIIDLVGAKNVTGTMRSIGAKDILVLRGVEDGKAFEKGLNNVTTAYDLMLVFQNIAQGKTFGNDASRAMIQILLDQTFNEIIPAELPDSVTVAHKTGSITGVQHDSGIVFLPDGRKYVLVLLSKNIGDEKAAIKAMANVSKLIYGQFEKNAF